MVSIIIPLRQDQGYLKNCVECCLAQKGFELEVIVLPDGEVQGRRKETGGRRQEDVDAESGWWALDPRVRFEATGPGRPARKRNRGAALSKGDILAFIDDDTRPHPDWLAAAMAHFADPKVGAVGGPSITPADDSFWAQVSGAAYESWMLSAGERLRYVPGKACDVMDYPSCNLLVRRSAFDEIGGFGTDFWPGEDTEFCLALIKKGYRIRYEPDAVIDHHRRPSLKKHFKQLANYGLHRGYFVKRYPETSRKLPYFMPSFMLVGGIGLVGASFCGSMPSLLALTALASLYVLLTTISLSWRKFSVAACAIPVIFLSHLAYGLAFLKGLLASRLPEEAES